VSRRRFLLTLSLCFLGLTILLSTRPGRAAAPSSGLPTPQPGAEDRLAIPTLPPNPSDVDEGRVIYYYHCMPCHGDRGQGLTDEFRHIWVEDHQNCWGRGCHAGRPGDEGFPIPRYIPAVSHTPALQARFPDFAALQGYLEATHPPQNPGVLTEAQYQQITAFVYAQNDLPLPRGNSPVFPLILFVGVTLLLGLLLIFQSRA
jgi:hypothetical protein